MINEVNLDKPKLLFFW